MSGPLPPADKVPQPEITTLSPGAGLPLGQQMGETWNKRNREEDYAGTFKLDHLQPVKLILFNNFSIFFPSLP